MIVSPNVIHRVPIFPKKHHMLDQTHFINLDGSIAHFPLTDTSLHGVGNLQISTHSSS